MTLGQALTEVLRDYGVKGDVVSLRGGPKWLIVNTYAVDENGHHFLDDDGELATEKTVLKVDLEPPGPPS